MGRANVTSDPKSELVIEICDISIACSHKAPFVDWYLVLQVEENAGLEMMTKQYRKLALQLHPDKNKHPKAEIAFKFLSEAYSCLSDDARRAKYNLKRKNSKCFECDKIGHASKIPRPLPKETFINSSNIIQKLGDLRSRLSEESKVIENCLKAISKSKRGNLSRNDYPVFNPVDYLFQGYPHGRTPIYKDSDNFHCFWKNNLLR